MGNQQEIFTAETKWQLLTAVAEQLHDVMRRYRRDRWHILGQTPPHTPDHLDPALRVSTGAVVPPFDWRTGIFWQRNLFSGRAPGLHAVIRAARYGQRRPPEIAVDFYACKQLTVLEFSPVRRGEPLASVHKEVIPASKPFLTVRVGLDYNARRRSTILQMAKGLAVALGAAARQAEDRQATATAGRRLTKQCLRAIRRSRTRRKTHQLYQWWIDPQKTPLRYTQLVFLAYLAREGMIDTASEGVVPFLRQVFSRSRMALNIFSWMARNFSMPERWTSLAAYLKRGVPRLTGNRQNARRWDDAIESIPETEENEPYDEDNGRNTDDRESSDPFDSDHDEASADLMRVISEESGRKRRTSGKRSARQDEYSVDEVAQRASVSRRTIYRWAKNERIPVRKQAGQLTFTTESLQAAQQLAKRRAREQENDPKRLLITCLERKESITREAARKRVTRALKSGQSLKDIVVAYGLHKSVHPRSGSSM